MEVKSICGLTAFFLMVAAIAGLLVNFIVTFTHHENTEVDTKSWPWIPANTKFHGTNFKKIFCLKCVSKITQKKFRQKIFILDTLKINFILSKMWEYTIKTF